MDTLFGSSRKELLFYLSVETIWFSFKVWDSFYMARNQDGWEARLDHPYFNKELWCPRGLHPCVLVSVNGIKFLFGYFNKEHWCPWGLHLSVLVWAQQLDSPRFPCLYSSAFPFLFFFWFLFPALTVGSLLQGRRIAMTPTQHK